MRAFESTAGFAGFLLVPPCNARMHAYVPSREIPANSAEGRNGPQRGAQQPRSTNLPSSLVENHGKAAP